MKVVIIVDKETVTRIYAMIDPRDNRVRYVGKTTKSLEDRLYGHWARVRAGATHQRDNWMRQLLSLDLDPIMETLEEGVWTRANADIRERYWIASFRAFKMPLTNMTDGGEGQAGAVVSQVTRQKHSEHMQRQWKDPAFKAKFQIIRDLVWTDAKRAQVGVKSRNNWSDPGYVQRVAHIRVCNDCKMTTTARSMGRHLKASSHSGYTELATGGDT